MKSENEEPEKCAGFKKLWFPDEVRLKYFPQTKTEFTYDILPLFEAEDYRKKLMDEVSIYSNPTYAEQWEKFKLESPTATKPKPVLLNSDNIFIFANYRRQKVPKDYYTSSAAPPSPEALFRRTK